MAPVWKSAHRRFVSLQHDCMRHRCFGCCRALVGLSLLASVAFYTSATAGEIGLVGGLARWSPNGPVGLTAWFPWTPSPASGPTARLQRLREFEVSLQNLTRQLSQQIYNAETLPDALVSRTKAAAGRGAGGRSDGEPAVVPSPQSAGRTAPASASGGIPAAPAGSGPVARAEAVRDAFRRAWSGYSQFCYGQDEFRPVSKTCSNWVHMGLTLIDALDSLWLMGMKDEFDKASVWVRDELRPDADKKVSFFESTIRVTGGLLSAYYLSGDKMFAEKAADVQRNLNKAFSATASGLPISAINLKTGRGDAPGWTGHRLILSEIGTISLEFNALSAITKDPSFAASARRVMKHLDGLQTAAKGLYPTLIDKRTGQPTNNIVTFGGMGDSFYEYELKTYLQLAKKDPMYKRMYLETVEQMRKRMVRDVQGGGLFVGVLNGAFLTEKMEHLVCFLPGTLALGVHTGVVEGDNAKEHMRIARGLLKTCLEMYAMTASGLAPDSVTFVGGKMHPDGNEFRLRPETVESVFYMWRITKEQEWRDAAWKLFQAMDTHCRVGDVGHANVADVNRPSAKEDRMESFWLAETLKYLYLTFSDDSLLPLDRYVFNTEAHPLRILSGIPPGGAGGSGGGSDR